MAAERPTLLHLKGVAKSFRRHGARVHAVRGVDLTVGENETVALVGESGSGKSTLARIALCLETPDQGEVWFDGTRMDDLPLRRLRQERTPIQPIFQDSAAAFNPRRTVGQILAQAMPHHASSHDLRERCAGLLEQIGLRPGEAYLTRFPHELSGGQKQRLGIARALAMEPRLIIADEPLSGADVSVRGQILNLLLDIQEARGLAFLFITHDISIAQALGHRVAVMYQGRIVEIGPADHVLGDPQHPYTRLLVSAVPHFGPQAGPARPPVRRTVQRAEAPPAGGCAFYPRCAAAVDACTGSVPALRTMAGDREVACHVATDAGAAAAAAE